MEFEKDVKNLFGIINKVSVETDMGVLLQLHRESSSLTDYYYRKYLNHDRYSLSNIGTMKNVDSIKINTIQNVVTLLELLHTKFDKQEHCFDFNKFAPSPNLHHTDMRRLKW